MTTFKALLISLAAVAAVARTPDAEARRLRVWYDAANEPSGFNRSGMLTEIQEAMREWEQHGAGKIVLEWRGVTTRRAGGGGDELIFGWDPGLAGTTACAETWIYTAFQLPPMGRVNFNPAFWGGRSIFTSLPITGVNCRVMRSVLMHETAHWFRWDIGHPTDSVLASTCATPGVCSDHVAMHLWNSDMGGINQNPYFPIMAPTYPPQPLLVLTDIYQETTGGVTHGGGFEVGPENFTASLGLGGPAFDYALAFTTVVPGNGHQIVVEQGNGRVPWGNRRLIGDDTGHQTCVTGVPGTADMYVAWAATRQRTIASTVGTPAFANAGERAVRFSESHDGGHTWSAPADVPGAFTRMGVSCGFDPARGRVVLAWTDSVSYLVRYSERSPGAAGATAWLAPRTMGSGGLPFVMTYETPLLSFDPFTPGSGLLTWTGSTHRAPLLARVAHGGTSYGIGWYMYATSVAEQNALRTNVVPNPFGTDIHFALGLNTPVPAQVRVRRREYVTLATETATSSSAAYDRYLGSGTNRGFFETAYLRQMIPRP
jgi:hypothetical protein